MVPTLRQTDVIQKLIDGSRDGRSIVPLLGAGISVEAGIPTLTALSDYLAKVQRHLGRELFRAPSTRESTEERQRRPRTKPPHEYLRDFGWPDPHRLESDLWAEVGGLCTQGHQHALERVVEEEILADLKRLDAELTKGLERQRGEADRLWQLLQGEEAAEAREIVERLPLLRPAPWKLKGAYWKRLLAHLTRSDPDLADTLFRRLVRGRQPGMAHRYLTFLVPVLRLRTFLTTNFDTLLEDALRMEGHQPVVYEIGEGAAMPNPSLVHEEASVIKLHGGAFHLRVGETLDSPLDRESRARLVAYLPDRPILLVLGVGGWDQRVLDMIYEVRVRRKADVVWLRHGREASEPVRDRFHEDEDDAVNKCAWHECQVLDPGAFLEEVFARKTSAHPAARYPYRALERRPVPEAVATVAEGDGVQQRRGVVHVFEDRAEDFVSLLNAADDGGAAVRLARWVDGKGKTHLPIWVDLESKHGVHDTVADIMTQLRRYDLGLPPELIAVERSLPGGGSFEKVLRRIYAALRRGRYVVALDSVGSLGRAPTQHHGQPSGGSGLGGEEGRRQIEVAREFLVALCKGAKDQVGGSLIALAINHQAARTESGSAGSGRGFADRLLPFEGEVVFHDRREGSRVPVAANTAVAPATLERLSPEEEKLLFGKCDEYRDAWLLVTAFRRRRSIVALRALLPDFTIPGFTRGKIDVRARLISEEWRVKAVKNFLESFEWCGCLLRIEGGYYRMTPCIRDRIYRSCDTLTRSPKLRMMVETRGDPEELAASLSQLATLAAIHDCIARYYQDLFAASEEVAALLEHLYHRISSLRYLTKLDALYAGTRPPVGPQLRDRVDHLFPQEVLGLSTKLLAEESLVSTRRLRLRMVRSLRGSLVSYRDHLLCGLPALALATWVDWVRDDDLRRFLSRTALREGPISPERAFRLCVEPGPAATAASPGADRPTEEGMEHKVLEETRRLLEVLDDVEIEVYQDRADKARVLERVRAWACRVRSVEPPAKPRRDPLDWLQKAGFDELMQSAGAGGAETRRRLQRMLYQTGTALRREGSQRAAIRRVGFRMDAVVKQWPVDDVSADRERVSILRDRFHAEATLARVSPWEAKGRTLRVLDEHRKLAGKALVHCERALASLEWIPEETGATRSLIHSLKGRAHYIRGQFHEAYREFDLSRAVLAPIQGVGAVRELREARALGFLRHAECLMLRADDSLLLWCCARRAHRTDRVSSEALSEVGLAKLEPAAEVGRDETEQARGLLDLSLSNWSREELDTLDDELDLNGGGSAPPEGTHVDGRAVGRDVVERAKQRLLAARDYLDGAERSLEQGRRSVEWWACLFQLRAQLQVERILLMITGDGPRAAVEDGAAHPLAWIDDRELRRRQIARMAEALRSGIRAIRQGLDILLPDDKEREGQEKRLAAHPLLQRFLRLWLELKVCGAQLHRLLSTRHSAEDLLHDWQWLNAREGIEKMVQAEAPRKWLQQKDAQEELLVVDEQTQRGNPGLVARGNALALMDEMLNAREHRDALVAAICAPRDEPRAGR